MSELAPLLQRFFTDRLINERNASRHTVAAYRDTFTLLLAFAAERTHRAPHRLGIEDLDAELIGEFLSHLENDRGNTVATRNTRLAGIRSFFRFASYRAPEHAATISRVLAIPAKRTERAVVSYLTADEAEALIRAPDPRTWTGRRDRTLLHVAIHTGLRVSELTGLSVADVTTGPGAHLRCHGKGRKNRATPLTKPSAAILSTWLTELRGQPADAVFPTRKGTALSRDAVAKLLRKHTATAAAGCRALAGKAVTPHTLRHTTAMLLLQGGVDLSVIALWLGHESTETTQIYLHADMSLKEKALARIETDTPPRPGRFRATDQLLEFLAKL